MTATVQSTETAFIVQACVICFASGMVTMRAWMMWRSRPRVLREPLLRAADDLPPPESVDLTDYMVGHLAHTGEQVGTAGLFDFETAQLVTPLAVDVRREDGRTVTVLFDQEDDQ